MPPQKLVEFPARRLALARLVRIEQCKKLASTSPCFRVHGPDLLLWLARYKRYANGTQASCRVRASFARNERRANVDTALGSANGHNISCRQRDLPRSVEQGAVSFSVPG
jgi:hypothetical protein